MEENIKYNYIIYHNRCFDGFTGFFLFMKTMKWTPKPTVFPDVPSATCVPPDIEGKNIVIIDVAYKPSIIKEIAKKANKMLFIDHHVTISDDIKNLGIGKPHEIVYDESYSGASLVWKHFFGDRKSMPRFVKYIEDNDIGKWEHEETLPFLVALEINFDLEPTFKNLKEWDKLLNEEFLTALVERGKVYNEYKNYLIDKSANKYSIKSFPSKKIINKFNSKGTTSKYKIGQYKVAVVNGACPSTSLVGKKIVENVDCDFAMLWNYIAGRNKYVISLRSKKTDVGSIAKIMGGGGHKLASSFAFYSDQFHFDDLFSSNKKIY
jgi:oligoribonuclease NrnB/cAMP/cGMP phosphodiesterase (DHH superfamily)